MTSARQIVKILQQTYPHAKCSLHFQNSWQLLVATILSAQCTDKRVNLVTPGLFQRFSSPHALASADIHEIEERIRSTGFYHHKAKAIQAASRMIVEKFHGRVPHTMEELLELPGVARKTANVVLGTAFHKPEGVVVDTHVKRLSFRLGFTKHTDPVKIEKDLMKLFPQKEWTPLAFLLIDHGRNICTAKSASCAECPLNKLCPSAFKV